MTESCGFHGVVPGLDRSSAAAERCTLCWRCLWQRTLYNLQAPVCVYTDNAALVTSLGTPPSPRDFAAYCRLVKQLLPEGSSIHWVPAHQRHPEGTVSRPGTTEAEIRARNHRRCCYGPAKPAFEAARLRCQWAAAIVQRQACLTAH